MLYIFDLDHTVIDSSHRKATLPDGSLDLDHWIENNTSEKIARDGLLPALAMLRSAFYSGKHTVVICTARVLSNADYEFFTLHNIPFHTMLDRPQGCLMADTDLKDIQLRLYAHQNDMTWREFCAKSVIIDDNQAVLSRMKSIGVPTMDAIELNDVLLKRAEQ